MKYHPPPLTRQLVHKPNQVTLQIPTLLPLRKLLHYPIRVLSLLLLQKHQQLKNILLYYIRRSCRLAVYLV